MTNNVQAQLLSTWNKTSIFMYKNLTHHCSGWIKLTDLQKYMYNTFPLFKVNKYASENSHTIFLDQPKYWITLSIFYCPPNISLSFFISFSLLSISTFLFLISLILASKFPVAPNKREITLIQQIIYQIINNNNICHRFLKYTVFYQALVLKLHKFFDLILLICYLVFTFLQIFQNCATIFSNSKIVLTCHLIGKIWKMMIHVQSCHFLIKFCSFITIHWIQFFVD